MPRLWCLSLSCVMQTALELVKDDTWKGGVKGGNEAAFHRRFMNCLSFSLSRRPGCSCFGQIPDLITKTEHMCRSLESGRGSSGKDASIAFWKFIIMVVLCMFFMVHCWKKTAAVCCVQHQPSVLWEHNSLTQSSHLQEELKPIFWDLGPVYATFFWKVELLLRRICTHIVLLAKQFLRTRTHERSRE